MVFLWGREINIHFIIFRDNDQHFQVDIYIPEECKIDQINDRNDLLAPSRTLLIVGAYNSGT